MKTNLPESTSATTRGRGFRFEVGIFAGAISGAAAGAFGGPIGVFAGALGGTVIGVLAAIALANDSAQREAVDSEREQCIANILRVHDQA